MDRVMQLELRRDRDGFTLIVDGVLDGSAAWRLCRVGARLCRRMPVRVDLSGVERLLTFGAAVLGARLPLLAGRVTLLGVRPEHARLLRASGVLAGS